MRKRSVLVAASSLDLRVTMTSGPSRRGQAKHGGRALLGAIVEEQSQQLRNDVAVAKTGQRTRRRDANIGSAVFGHLTQDVFDLVILGQPGQLRGGGPYTAIGTGQTVFDNVEQGAAGINEAGHAILERDGKFGRFFFGRGIIVKEIGHTVLIAVGKALSQGIGHAIAILVDHAFLAVRNAVIVAVAIKIIRDAIAIGIGLALDGGRDAVAVLVADEVKVHVGFDGGMKVIPLRQLPEVVGGLPALFAAAHGDEGVGAHEQGLIAREGRHEVADANKGAIEDASLVSAHGTDDVGPVDARLNLAGLHSDFTDG